MIVLASMAVPSHSGGLGGALGGVTGAVGSVVGGVTGSLGGAIGGVAGAAGGAAGGATSGATSQDQASNDTTSTTKNGVFHSAPLTKKALVKAKVNVLGIKAGVYVLDGYGNLIRVNAKALGHLKAKANVYALRHGSLVKIDAKVGLAGLKVKGKVFVIDQHGNLLKGKVLVGLGGLKAKVGAKVGLDPIQVKVGVSIGSRKPRTPGNPGNPGNPPNNPGNPGNPPGGIDDGIASLSSYERAQLKKKCVSVLSSPASYTRDTVQVCRVLAQLAGL